ncbi:hypothetical protein Pcinc_006722 [Petrolisthes cinctipes]|uniref:Neurotransmitter-gated ion-channel ligand-binding domain-containing protein n=1 Tax=Petrolisthes cinctipes TaxID=88211 RepID=A0AAE1GGS7_PETCI|nr:hypothetical protein Pcinc_006722 [Petrolisthes cinctipes]
MFSLQKPSQHLPTHPKQSYALKLTFACMMELSRFPLDVQVCTMEIGSFLSTISPLLFFSPVSKTTQELNLSWKHGDPIKIYRGLKMPQFNIIANETDRCHEDFQIGEWVAGG